MEDINVNSFLYSGGIPIYPESLPLDHILVEIETQKEYTVLDFLDHNNNELNPNFEADLESFLLYATLEDKMGNQFTLSIDMFNNIYLQTIVQEISTSSSFLSVEDYAIYLKEFRLRLNKLRYYVNYAATIHKEAIQDAVDIVQSKRLDFADTKEEKIDVAGILTVAISLAFFELGLGAAAFGFIGSKLGSSVFVKTLLDSFSKMLGKKGKKERKTSNIKALEEELNIVILSSEKLSNKANRLLPRRNKTKSKNKHRSGLKVERLETREKQIKSEIKSEINDEERYQKELIMLGKETFLDVVKNNKGNVKDLAEPLLEEGIKELSAASDSVNANAIPLDVYFKTSIQNFYETPLFVIDKMILLLDEMIFYQDCYGIENEEELGFHQFFLNKFSLNSINRSIIAYEEIFNEEDFSFTNAKFNQTRAYELTLWVLLLKNKITSKLNPLTITDSDAFNPGPMDPNVPLTISVLDLEDNITQYLAKRFGLNIEKSALANTIENAYQTIMNQKDSINNQLNSSEELKYKIGLIS